MLEGVRTDVEFVLGHGSLRATTKAFCAHKIEFGEIVSIFVGQCGVQMANACWELFCVEHGIDPDGNRIVLLDAPQASDDKELYDCNTFFHENAKGQCTPRTVLLDSEPTVLDEVRGGVYQNLFNAKSLVNGKEDAASNYARGFYQMGQSYKEPFVDSLRKIAEACDLLNGLCFFHSYGGGTGSGLLMALEEHIDNSFIKQAKFDFGIYPSQQQVSSIVEPYNAILAASSPCRMESISLFFDNRSIIKVIRDRLKKDSISYTTMNRLLAQVFGEMTANLRFSSLLSAKLTDLGTNLIPYPSMEFLMCGMAPIMDQKTLDRTKISCEGLILDALNDDNQLAHSEYTLHEAVFMSCALLYRGDVSAREVSSSVDEAKRRRYLLFADWSPCGYKIGICNQPMTTVTSSGIAASPRSLCALFNCTAVRGCLTAIHEQYRTMKERKAFYHWYLYEGMEEEEFEEAFEESRDLLADYDLVENCQKDEKACQPGTYFGRSDHRVYPEVDPRETIFSIGGPSISAPNSRRSGASQRSKATASSKSTKKSGKSVSSARSSNPTTTITDVDEEEEDEAEEY